MNRFLPAAITIVLAVQTCAAADPAEKKAPGPKGAPAAEAIGWRLGAQAYTFRRFTFFEAVDKMAALGLKYVEMYPGQRVSKGISAGTNDKMSPEVTAKLQAKLKAAGVKLVCYGVTHLPGNEAACRKIFQWAKKMGIETIVSEPNPKDLPMIDKLCNEFGINVAIHNHPKASRYWNPDTVLAACKGLSKRVGACADTGHWARSGLDPIECLKKLEGRIISFHLKDLNKKERGAHDVPWGTGACDAAGMLAEMHRQGFKGVFSIEYESKFDHATLAKCVAFFNEQAARLAKVAAPAAGGWQVVFKEDLSNATFRKGAWELKDGVLSVKGKGDIWTRDRYADFVLDFEFKVAPGTNSGVFIRCGSISNWLHTAIEVQILDSHGRKPGKHCCGAIFDCLAPSRQMVKKPGEWNRMAITCKANKIEVVLNGQRIIDMDLDKWTEAHKNPNGSRNKFNTAYKDMPRVGYIGFQYHGHPVWYRNIKIKTLGSV